MSARRRSRPTPTWHGRPNKQSGQIDRIGRHTGRSYHYTVSLSPLPSKRIKRPPGKHGPTCRKRTAGSRAAHTPASSRSDSRCSGWNSICRFNLCARGLSSCALCLLGRIRRSAGPPAVPSDCYLESEQMVGAVDVVVVVAVDAAACQAPAVCIGRARNGLLSWARTTKSFGARKVTRSRAPLAPAASCSAPLTGKRAPAWAQMETNGKAPAGPKTVQRLRHRIDFSRKPREPRGRRTCRWAPLVRVRPVGRR